MLRALVSTKDAGVIIGKGGKNVAELREMTGVKAGVSKVVPGVHERVLTVNGSPDAIAKAYQHIIAQLVSAGAGSPDFDAAAAASNPNTMIRLLISHNLMGTIIGRQGLKIKAIQDASGARLVASKDMLPQSTERVVEVHGLPDQIGRAIYEIAKSLLEDWERSTGTVLYYPQAADASTAGARRPSTNGYSPNAARRRPSSPTPSAGSQSTPSALIRTQNISIPSDMVGCIIGRGGTKITEIRRLSGSKISIAKAPHDETGERMFTIVGSPEANEKALYLLYNQLESEKERRVGREQSQNVAMQTDDDE
ncbi:cytoplasmic protein [Schizophyllum amplum]|uniref:Cytoplasmic protein n=1 Tax=Schizophyllum amplum TaxID=97359 RepID=A0A550CN31_9AGAR|nr:cytoplasmic protein [Auriculariopsis ampla]